MKQTLDFDNVLLYTISMGRKALSSEIISNRLAKAGLTLIGEYSGKAKDIHRVVCSSGHERSATLHSMLMGHECQQCARLTRTKSKDSISERLTQLGFTIVGDYVNTHSKTTFKCKNNHEFISCANSILKVNGSGCKTCSVESAKLPKSAIFSRLLNKNIEMLSNNPGNVHTKQIFRCHVGHEWEAELNSLLRTSSHGCPECSVSGFKKDKPAHAYILIFDDFIKYGISNRLKIRLNEHKSNGEYEIHTTRFFERGSDALEWESMIKKVFGGSFVSKYRCADGFTETLSLSRLDEVSTSLLTWENNGKSQ